MEQQNRAPPATDYLVALDDDPTVYRIVEATTHLTTLPFSSVEGLLKVAERYQPAACLVDIRLGEDENGLDAVPHLLRHWPDTPIIVMTADTSENLIAQALAAGACDFLHKPLTPTELRARLSVRIREYRERAQQSLVRVGDVVLNDRIHCIEHADKRIFVSPAASDLLSLLAEPPGVLVAREALKRKIWRHVTVSDNNLDAKISELRRALRTVGSSMTVKSHYGKGVQLVATSHDNP